MTSVFSMSKAEEALFSTSKNIAPLNGEGDQTLSQRDSRVRSGGGEMHDLQQQVALLQTQMALIQTQMTQSGTSSTAGSQRLSMSSSRTLEAQEAAAVNMQKVVRGKEARSRFKMAGLVSKEFNTGEVDRIKKASRKARTDSAARIMTDPKHGGRAAKIFLCLGGLQEFPKTQSPWVDNWVERAYEVTWLLVLSSCGAACWANLRYQQVPSHNVPTDLLTAYVHIPAIQGWYATPHHILAIRRTATQTAGKQQRRALHCVCACNHCAGSSGGGAPSARSSSRSSTRCASRAPRTARSSPSASSGSRAPCWRRAAS